MDKRTNNWPTYTLLIDDNPSTAILILRLFNYLGCRILYADQAEQIVKFSHEEQFDLILINQAFSGLEKDCLPRLESVEENTSIIYYSSSIIINDFMDAAMKAGKDIHDDSWMLFSEFFHFLH